MKRTLLLIALAVASCARPRVQSETMAPAQPMPPPSRVVVSDFAITPDQVRLDSGVAAELRRESSGEAPAEQQAEIARAAQAAMSTTLTRRLASYGLPAEYDPPGTVPPPNSVLVAGQILSVDQGNRTRRVLIGFGAGKSSMEADAQVYYVGPDGRQMLVQSATGYVDSGRMPGAVPTMGVGAAGNLGASAAISGVTHVGAEAHRTGEEALADKLGTEVARQIGHFAATQGWIPASAVQ